MHAMLLLRYYVAHKNEEISDSLTGAPCNVDAPTVPTTGSASVVYVWIALFLAFL
jgi:hypothetical protein